MCTLKTRKERECDLLSVFCRVFSRNDCSTTLSSTSVAASLHRSAKPTRTHFCPLPSQKLPTERNGRPFNICIPCPRKGLGCLPRRVKKASACKCHICQPIITTCHCGAGLRGYIADCMVPYLGPSPLLTSLSNEPWFTWLAERRKSWLPCCHAGLRATKMDVVRVAGWLDS
jgi:hypothetical protein